MQKSTKFIKVNWQKLYANFRDDYGKTFFTELNEIRQKANQYHSKVIQEDREIEQKLHTKELKELPINTILYFIGNSNRIQYGEKIVKMADRRTTMEGIINGEPWYIHYIHLSKTEPTKDEHQNRAIAMEAMKIVSGINLELNKKGELK